jgi:hypothetical protein
VVKLKINRKEIIIQEIEYWKASKLLPEMYCDYLLTLYTEGDHNIIEKRKEKTRIPLFLLLFSVFPITYLFIYFTELSFHLQMLFKSFFLLILIVTVFIFRKNPLFLHLLIVYSAIFLLIFSIEIYEHFFQANNITMISFIIGNCTLWIILGVNRKFRYFFISGVVGFIIAFVIFFI